MKLFLRLLLPPLLVIPMLVNAQGISVRTQKGSPAAIIRVAMQRRTMRLLRRDHAQRDALRKPAVAGSSVVLTSIRKAHDPLSDLRDEVVELVNEERAKVGVGPVIQNTALQDSAQKHAEDMKEQQYFSHTDLDGHSSADRMKASGYPGASTLKEPCPCKYYFGENIARGQETPKEVVEAWMNSPDHKENILSPHYKEIGIGFIDNHWVQNFGGVFRN